MSEYAISQIYPSDRRANTQINKLLLAEGIRRDANLDYTCGMYDDEMNIIATGSCFGNTLRCMAVSSAHQGEGLMNQIVTHLISVQFERGNTHLFLYTKCNSAKFFGDLGFYEIAQWMRENEIHPSRQGIFVNSIVTCMEMVERGLGWGIVPELCLKNFSGHVQPLIFKNGEPFVRSTYLIYTNAVASLPQAQAFIHIVKNHGR